MKYIISWDTDLGPEFMEVEVDSAAEAEYIAFDWWKKYHSVTTEEWTEELAEEYGL